MKATLRASTTVVPSTGRKARPGIRPWMVRFLSPSARSGLSMGMAKASEQCPESIDEEELVRFHERNY